MIHFLTIIIVLAAIILTFVVLIQNSKGGGLAAGFASANQVLGVKQTTDRIEKLTWILIAVIVLLSIVSARMISSSHATVTSNVNTEQVQQPVAQQPTEAVQQITQQSAEAVNE